MPEGFVLGAENMAGIRQKSLADLVERLGQSLKMRYAWVPDELLWDVALLLAKCVPTEKRVAQFLERLEAAAPDGAPDPDSDLMYHDLLAMLVETPHWRAMQRYLTHLRTRDARGVPERDRRSNLAIEFLAEQLASRLLRCCDLERSAEANLPILDSGQAEAIERKGHDVADWLLRPDDLVKMAMIASVRAPRHLLQSLDERLLAMCLYGPAAGDERLPRELMEVAEEGERREALPGLTSSPFAISVKTHDEQLKDVLVSEWAPFLNGERGEVLVLDKWLNRRPLIVEHRQPLTQKVSHRVLLTFLIGADCEQRGKRSGAAAAPAARMMAYRRCRMSAFRMLALAALLVPQDEFDVEVAWMDRRQGEWVAGAFPLERFRASRGQRWWWLNVAEMNWLMPYFLTRFLHGLNPGARGTHEAAFRRGVSTIREKPEQYLEQRFALGGFDHGPVVSLMCGDERALCLPLDREPPKPPLAKAAAVLLASVSPADQRLGARTFATASEAASAKMPLPRRKQTDMEEIFLDMLIGAEHDRGDGKARKMRRAPHQS